MAVFKVGKIDDKIVLIAHNGLVELLDDGDTYTIDTEEYFKKVKQ